MVSLKIPNRYIPKYRANPMIYQGQNTVGREYLKLRLYKRILIGYKLILEFLSASINFWIEI